MRERFELWLLDLLKNLRVSDLMASVMLEIIYLLAIIVLCGIIYLISKKIIIKVLGRVIYASPYKWDNAFMDSKFLERVINIIPAVVFYALAYLMPTFQKFIELLLTIYLSFMIVFAAFGFLDAINSIYEKNIPRYKERPLKGFIQIFKIFSFIVALIIVIAKLLGQSPVYLLSGIGALSAVIMLIFKDSILGMVAGIQMSSNDLVRIGDWIEMPKYGADGDVVDISLTVVKVENFDRTITTIPSYALVSDSFKNWRGMQNAGGRRIKRSINIDVSSITFCSDEMLKELSKIEYLKAYIASRQEEIDKHNKDRKIDTSTPVNGRRMTNIGVFRKYTTEYLNNHPKIHKNMIIMVRQLAPDNQGVPIEIYAFTNDTAWVNYEGIMADIFDHLFAVVSFFGLRIFQDPTGHDIKSIKA